MHWIKVTLILCFFGTLREIRPSEPFVSEFLLGEWRNITNEQLNQQVYPVGTYSYLAQLLLVFLVTDFLRFKPIIILSGLTGVAVYAILLWSSSLEWLQVSQFFYGLYMATEVGYLTYIYAKVDTDKYLKVSSYTRMAALTGRFISGVSCQVLVLTGAMNYRDLNYITFTAQILATCWALWLPPVQYSIYFHRKNSLVTNLANDAKVSKNKQLVEDDDKYSSCSKMREAASLIANHARMAYTRGAIIAWSALYATALALFVQVQTYVQLLWIDIQAEGDSPIAFNGFVEAIQTLLGSGGAFTASLYGNDVVPGIVAVTQGVAVFVGTFVRVIYVSYAGYIVMGALFHYTITYTSAKIAQELKDESCFGLIFGINTFLGTALQSILTFVLINQLQLTIYMQYITLSVFFVILGVLWFSGWSIQQCKTRQVVVSSENFDQY